MRRSFPIARKYSISKRRPKEKEKELSQAAKEEGATAHRTRRQTSRKPRGRRTESRLHAPTERWGKRKRHAQKEERPRKSLGGRAAE